MRPETIATLAVIAVSGALGAALMLAIVPLRLGRPRRLPQTGLGLCVDCRYWESGAEPRPQTGVCVLSSNWPQQHNPSTGRALALRGTASGLSGPAVLRTNRNYGCVAWSALRAAPRT